MRTMKTLGLMIAAGGICAVAIAAAQKDSARALYQQAIHEEQALGDVTAAMTLYERVVATSSDRELTAKAELRLAGLYQKLGRTEEARTRHEKIVARYQGEPALAELVKVARAALGPTVRTINVTESGPVARQVWTGQDAFGSVRGAISPDGRYLTFLHLGTSGLAVRDLKEGTSRVLTHESGSVWYSIFSPDGRQVAYGWTTLTGKDRQSDLRLLSLTAGEPSHPRIVYRNAEMVSIRPFGWSPDGKEVLVLRSLRDGTNQIAMIAVADGSIRVLKSLSWNYAAMSLSPDGRYVAYESQVGNDTAPSEIFVLAADGSRETKVVQGPAVNSSPLWTPDGSRILFLTDRTGNTSLWMIPIENGKPKGPAELVKADIGRVRLLGITRSGALHYLVSGVRRSNVYIAELDGSMKAMTPPTLASERFMNSNSAPAWSPDGRHLAYLSSRGPSGTVLVIRTPKTGEERDIPLPKEVQTGNLVPVPRWFPDGGSVLVMGYQLRDGVYYRVDVASGKAELLHTARGAAAGGGLGAAVISVDGKAFLYTRRTEEASDGNLVRFDIEARHETVLKSGAVGAVALSPDGTQLAVRLFDGTAGSCSLEVMPVGGGETREVLRPVDCNPNRLAWSPDQRYLLFVKGFNTGPNVLSRVSVDGGPPEDLGISMPGQLMYPDVHPDGRRVAFGVFETGASEVWTLESFLPKPAPAR